MTRVRPQITVVVPVYNSVLYLQECVDSVLSQSLRDIEVMLVDDGSTDGSAAVCDRFGEVDERVRVIHQPNGGVTSARRCGVQCATAPWLTFVDSDDTLPVDALQALYDAREGTDMVIGKIFDDSKLPAAMTVNEFCHSFAQGPQFHCGPCAKLFRTEQLCTSAFDIPREIVRGEDRIMNLRYAFNMTLPPRFIDKKVYNYRLNEASVMHSTRRTVEHAELFTEHLVKSVPSERLADFERDFITSRLQSIANIIYDNPTDRSWQQSDFYLRLQDDIKSTGYKLSISQRLALMPRGRYSRSLVMRLQQLFN